MQRREMTQIYNYQIILHGMTNTSLFIQCLGVVHIIALCIVEEKDTCYFSSPEGVDSQLPVSAFQNGTEGGATCHGYRTSNISGNI